MDIIMIKKLIKAFLIINILMIMVISSQKRENDKDSSISSKRQLAGLTNASQSTISGNGTSGYIKSLLTYVVVVTAKDYSGDNVGHGGDQIQITNQCIKGAGSNCISVVDAKQSISSPIIAMMTDNGDGTYSFQYSISVDGAITIIVQLLNGAGVKGDWYNNVNWSGAPTFTNYSSVINFVGSDSQDWVGGSGSLFTATITSKIRPLFNETYTFTLNQDDGCRLVFDGITKFDNRGVAIVRSDSFSINLNSENYYDLQIDYYQQYGGITMVLEWNSASTPQQIVPASIFSISDYVGVSPIQVTVNCTTGYTKFGFSTCTIIQKLY